MSQEFQVRPFDYAATLIANVMVQLVMLCVFYFISTSPLPVQGGLIASLLYWLMALVLYKRRLQLSLLERIALRMGFGILLPVSVLLAFWLRNIFAQ